MIEIEIQSGDITEAKVDAIVNPANTYGWMGGGVAGAIKQKGGEEIEKEIVAKGHMELGKAVSTTAGELPFKSIIHAPTMENPADKATSYNVAMAVKGALHFADDQGYESIAVPGMGTGVGDFPVEEAAQLMMQEIKAFKPLNLKRVVLIDLNESMIKAWEKANK